MYGGFVIRCDFFFLWECGTSSWKKALHCLAGFDSVHKTLQQIRFPCRRNCRTAVPSVGRFRRSANKGATHCHQCTTKLWYHLTFYVPVLSFKKKTKQTTKHWRLAHRKDCLDKKLYPLLVHKHRVPTQKCSVCYVFIGRFVKASAQVKASTAGASSHLKMASFLPPTSHQGGWPPTTGWLRATRVSSVTSASKCCTTMPRATRWGNSWPTLT